MGRLITVFFIAVEALMYAVFMFFDITGTASGSSSNIKYASILICAVTALAAAVIAVARADADDKGKATGKLLLAAAMLFTAFADRFLLFENFILPGIISFCAVQTIYLFVITGGSLRRAWPALLVRAAAGIAAAVFLKDYADGSALLAGAVVFYGISFAGNIVHLAVSQARRKGDCCLFEKSGLFLAGLILFLMCDINVFIFNIGGYVNIDPGAYEKLTGAASVLMWAFYLPSQVMIVLSGTWKKTEKTIE